MPSIVRTNARRRRIDGLLGSGALLAAVPTMALAQAQPPAAPSLMPIVLALAAVLALIPVALWLLKRFGAVGAPQVEGLQVVSQLPLGTGQKIVVLQAGNRWLLLGVTGSSITRVGSLSKPPVDAGLASAGPIAPPSFSALLARAVRGDRSTP
jgi:flagellar protein FliO/FliZ